MKFPNLQLNLQKISSIQRVSKKQVLDLDIKVELDYHDGLDVDIHVDIQFDPLSKPDENIAEDAADHAIAEIDSYLADN